MGRHRGDPERLGRRAAADRAPLGGSAARRSGPGGRLPHQRRLHQPARPGRDRAALERGGEGAPRHGDDPPAHLRPVQPTTRPEERCSHPAESRGARRGASRVGVSRPPAASVVLAGDATCAPARRDRITHHNAPAHVDRARLGRRPARARGGWRAAVVATVAFLGLAVPTPQQMLDGQPLLTRAGPGPLVDSVPPTPGRRGACTASTRAARTRPTAPPATLASASHGLAADRHWVGVETAGGR